MHRPWLSFWSSSTPDGRIHLCRRPSGFDHTDVGATTAQWPQCTNRLDHLRCATLWNQEKDYQNAKRILINYILVHIRQLHRQQIAVHRIDFARECPDCGKTPEHSTILQMLFAQLRHSGHKVQMIFLGAGHRWSASSASSSTTSAGGRCAAFRPPIVGMNEFSNGIHNGERWTRNEDDMLDVHIGQFLDHLEIENFVHIALLQPGVLGDQADGTEKRFVPDDGLREIPEFRIEV